MNQFRIGGLSRLATTAAICFGLVSLASVGSAQVAPQDFRAGAGEIVGIWWPADHSSDVKPLDGPIVYTPAGTAALAKNVAALKSSVGKPKQRDDLTPCLPAGPVRILQQPYPLQIVQKGRMVVLIYEHNHVYEIVYIGDPPGEAEKADPSYMGYSSGTWTNGELFVATSNFNAQTMLSDMGIPHSNRLNVMRKIRMIDAGKRLEILSTITDPVMFKNPWTVRQVLEPRPDTRIEEYVCGQGTLETRYTRQARP